MNKQDIPLPAELRPGAIYHVKVKSNNNYHSTGKTRLYLTGWLKEHVPECKFIVTSDNVSIGESDTNKELVDSLELAWGIIANSGGGDWKKASEEWQKAAAAWRDRYHALLKKVK